MLRSGSICASFLYNYLLSESNINNKNSGDKLIENGHKLKCLSDTFASYGGVLGKLSQILCFENEKSDAFSDCKPYCQAETVEYIKDMYIDDKNREFFKDISYFDFNVFKAGSVGQVHRCIYKNGEDIIIKVQYVGLFDQFQSDIYILDKLTSYLFYFADVTSAMTDIKTKLYEELDYKLEFNNQQKIYDLWFDHKNIKIPQLIPALCTDKLLGMYYIDSEGLPMFIENSTQEQRNLIGKYIVEFVFVNFYKYGIFYSDIHYGNFLIKDKDTLYVTDFGCLNYIDDSLLIKLKKLHICMINENKVSFYDIVADIGIIKDDISYESKEYIYEYFKLQYSPWMQEEFEFTEEWLTKSVYKNPTLMKEWILPSNCVYLNKIPYGCYHILTKLGLKGNFLSFFKELLGEF